MSKLCTICGEEIPDGEEFIVDGQVLCHEHFAEMYVECADCGDIVRIDDTILLHNGNRVCNSCIEGNYFQCDDCGEWCPTDEAYVVNRGCRDEKYVCPDCIDNFARCDHCDDYFTDNHIWAHDWNTTICDDCSDYYYICADCGAIIHADYTYWHEDDEDTPRCEDCYSTYGERHRSRAIHDYGYKPYPIFGTTDSWDGSDSYDGDELTFGVELECDKGYNPREAAEAVCNLTDRLYCKHDGSLSDGYEIVTHPATLAYHMQVFPWADICKTSIDHDFKSHDAQTCGLHIHIGRRQLGDTAEKRRLTVANIILLTETLWPEIVRFSRRGGKSRWAHMNSGIQTLDDCWPCNEATAARDVVRDANNSGRYLAVNVQNDSTVELRFNRGSLVVGTILASLQLASNLATFAKTHTMDECLDAKWDDVVHCCEYDELNAYVAKRFAGWTQDIPRPHTDFRFSKLAAEEHEEGYLFDWEHACKLVTDGAFICDEGHVITQGQLVVLTRRENPDLANNGPRVGSIGVCVREGDGYNWPLFMWNDTSRIGLHNGGYDDLPNRCYFVSPRDVRLIRTYRSGYDVDADVNYYCATHDNIIPGDIVHALNNGTHRKGIVYQLSPGYNPTACVAWEEWGAGHNGPEEVLRSTPFRRRGWNYGTGDIALN